MSVRNAPLATWTWLMFSVSVPLDAAQCAVSIGAQTGANPTREEEFLEQFPQRQRTVSRPAVITDWAGRLLAWLLPGLLQRARQVCSFCAVIAHV